MTLAEIRNELGSRINQTDGSGDFASTIITSTEADRWINQAMEQVYMWYALANREKFQQSATFNIVANQNSYTLGGDAATAMAIMWLGIKFNSTDSDFTRVWPMNYPDIYFQTDDEKYVQSDPHYYRTMTTVSSVPTNTIVIDPTPDANVTAGGKLIYLKPPATLSSDSDVPSRIPSQLHKHIVDGAAVNAFYKLERDDRAASFSKRFQSDIQAFIIQDLSNKQDMQTRPRPSVRDIDTFFRRNR